MLVSLVELCYFLTLMMLGGLCESLPDPPAGHSEGGSFKQLQALPKTTLPDDRLQKWSVPQVRVQRSNISTNPPSFRSSRNFEPFE